MNTSTSSLPTSAATPLWQYTRPAMVLHWMLAIFLVCEAALGWYMMSIEEEPGSADYFNLHRSIGLIIALLVAARIVWRLNHKPQALPDTVAPWQRKLSVLTETLLYVVMVLMPVTGYVGASYSKAGVAFFGAATPRWAQPDHDTAELFYGAHSILIWVLTALVALHVAGALWHVLVEKDTVFKRMWR
ncbi:MAG: cytochrome b [Burkholderiaceae bacterium]|nr:cytochrome b [Burkholderiaceae bacterium]